MKFLGILILFVGLFFKALISPSLQPGFNFILLGLDPRNDVLEKTETTDTIILGRLGSDWKLSLISIPRDLWFYSIDSKVNQIYPKSLTESNPLNYIETKFSDLTSIAISRAVVITTKDLENIADLIGGVDVYLEKGFTDNLYPNPEYIKNPSPKTPIYITITYPQGLNHLDSSNIAPFVRSRHSAETAAQGGTDIGRSVRQQLLIDALINKLRSSKIIYNPKIIYNLYQYWHQNINTDISDLDIFSLILSGKKQIFNIKISKTIIPTGENQKTDILYHPKKFINSQWVFIPQDKEYQSFHNFIREQFAILNY